MDASIGKLWIVVLTLSMLVAAIDINVGGANFTPTAFGLAVALVCVWRVRSLHPAFTLAFGAFMVAIVAEAAWLVAISASESPSPHSFALAVGLAQRLSVLAGFVCSYAGVALAAPRRLKPRTNTTAWAVASIVGAALAVSTAADSLLPEMLGATGFLVLAAALSGLWLAIVAETPLDG